MTHYFLNKLYRFIRFKNPAQVLFSFQSVNVDNDYAYVVGLFVVVAVVPGTPLQANAIDAEFETVCHFPSDKRNPTFHLAPVGSPKFIHLL